MAYFIGTIFSLKSLEELQNNVPKEEDIDESIKSYLSSSTIYLRETNLNWDSKSSVDKKNWYP